MQSFLLNFYFFGIISCWIACGENVNNAENIPQLPHAQVEKYCDVPYAAGNIAFTHKGELVFSNHPFFDPAIRVMYLNDSTKKATPFPNTNWNTPQRKGENFLSTVLGIRNDDSGVVWMLDMGLKNHITPKLVGWNTRKNQLEKIYFIPAPASLPTSQHNDFVIDNTHQVFIIADEGIGHNGDGTHAALVIVDKQTGKCRRLLDGHYSTIPENKPININHKILTIPNTQTPLLVGADGITADKNNEWLYYAPLNGTKVYRIRIADLLNEKLSSKILGDKVETYAEKENNGGLSIDENNNLYLTYIENNSIGVIDASTKKSYHYAQNTQLIWPDGISYNKDGYMYIAAAQLQLGSAFNNEKDLTQKPFSIYKIKPIAKGIWGR